MGTNIDCERSEPVTRVGWRISLVYIYICIHGQSIWCRVGPRKRATRKRRSGWLRFNGQWSCTCMWLEIGYTYRAVRISYLVRLCRRTYRILQDYNVLYLTYCINTACGRISEPNAVAFTSRRISAPHLDELAGAFLWYIYIYICDRACRNQNHPYGAICNFSLRAILSLGGCFTVLFFLTKTMVYPYGIYVPGFTAVGPSFQP